MKRLILFDTETFEQKTVLDSVKKYTVFDAKHGRKEVSVLLTLLFAIIIAVGIFAVVAKHTYDNDISKMQYYCDSIETKEELDELHYLTGYLYLQTEHGKPNEDTVYNFITSCNPWYPEYIVAQASIESGFGTSDIGKNANNLFGMKYIDQTKPHRPTTQIPGASYKGYGVYASWELSVVDRIMWELCWYDSIKPSQQKYENNFDRYAEAEEYVDIVKALANRYKNKN